MSINRILFGIFLLMSLAGCFREHVSQEWYSRGTFPETITNLGDVNSVDDDYNSALPFFGEVMPLVFSSKRGGRSDFNFVWEWLNYSFDRRTGAFTLDNKPYGWLDVVEELTPVSWAAQKANSTANELGPLIKSYDHDLINDGFNRHYGEYLMLFASDREGNLDVYLMHNYRDNSTNTSAIPGSSTALAGKSFADPVPLPFLNSSADDAYPSFSNNYSAIYFTSNRGGSFDIFRADLPAIAPAELQARLPGLVDVPVERVAGLSSTADDKCPYIMGDMLVFTSNRPGGYGGFDLYYSKWNGNNWSSPVNFGPAINTSFDEYRPILAGTTDFSNQLMIFSSNRPGGKGGFDLYLVGVPK
ncbi:hypothetical protein WBJ53_11330 [Spirosoma sp. SC4-14]|uniref:TolB family protein n=1 Tax=Spirosoma sp. SC4-14 TaxID=3128900 RepID=UPI0030CF71CF